MAAREDARRKLLRQFYGLRTYSSHFSLAHRSYQAWNKPPVQDVNAWERLGNPGWNWERFSDYTKKVEK